MSDVDRIIQRWDGTHWRTTLQGLTAYTPTYTGLTVGTGGTSTGGYSRTEHTVTAQGEVTFGTGGAVTADLVYATLPVANRWVDTVGSDIGQPGVRQLGYAAYFDASAARIHRGACDATVRIPGRVAFYSSSPNQWQINPTNPFTWAAGDEIWWKVTYDAADDV